MPCDRLISRFSGRRATVVGAVVLGVAALTLAACGSSTQPTSTSPQSAGAAESREITLVFSQKPRATASDVPAADLEELADGNTQFALDLYQVLREVDGNLFYSPYSISLALALAYAGARGNTEQQMAETLRFTLPQARLHPAFNALDQELASRAEGGMADEGSRFQLNIVNALWGQEGYQFLDAYLDTLAENYGAGMRLLDFISAPEPSRLIINDWVAEQTEDRIKDLIPQGGITMDTRLVLTNAIYFNASWLKPFDPEDTTTDTCTRLDGSQVQVPMMHQSIRTLYVDGDGYEAVRLPYSGNAVEMVVIAPDAGEFAAFEARFDAATLDAIIEGLSDTLVTLSLPTFEFESATGLKSALVQMGMPVVFTPEADLSGINGTPGLFIGDVLHKAFVAVDEEGTEAAAATAVIIEITSIPPSATLTVDRPFIFLIRDRETGTVLFLGRVLDPGA